VSIKKYRKEHVGSVTPLHFTIKVAQRAGRDNIINHTIYHKWISYMITYYTRHKILYLGKFIKIFCLTIVIIIYTARTNYLKKIIFKCQLIYLTFNLFSFNSYESVYVWMQNNYVISPKKIHKAINSKYHMGKISVVAVVILYTVNKSLQKTYASFVLPFLLFTLNDIRNIVSTLHFYGLSLLSLWWFTFSALLYLVWGCYAIKFSWSRE